MININIITVDLLPESYYCLKKLVLTFFIYSDANIDTEIWGAELQGGSAPASW